MCGWLRAGAEVHLLALLSLHGAQEERGNEAPEIQLLGISGAGRWRIEVMEEWGAVGEPRSFPITQWSGGRGLAEDNLSLYVNGHTSCVYSETGWLVPEAQEHTMSEEKEREVVRETREHHALPTRSQGEGKCRRD